MACDSAAAASCADEAHSIPARTAGFACSLPESIKYLLPQSFGGLGVDEAENSLYQYIIGIPAESWFELSPKSQRRLGHIAGQERSKFHARELAQRFAVLEGEIADDKTMTHDEFLAAVVPNLSHDLRGCFSLGGTFDSDNLGGNVFYLALRDALPSRPSEAIAVDTITRAIKMCVKVMTADDYKRFRFRRIYKTRRRTSPRHNLVDRVCKSWHGTASSLVEAMDGTESEAGESPEYMDALAQGSTGGTPLDPSKYHLTLAPDRGGLSAEVSYTFVDEDAESEEEADAGTIHTGDAGDAGASGASSLSAASAGGFPAATGAERVPEPEFPTLAEMVRRHSMSS